MEYENQFLDFDIVKQKWETDRTFQVLQIAESNCGSLFYDLIHFHLTRLAIPVLILQQHLKFNVFK